MPVKSKKPKKAKVIEIVDTELYEIEKIGGNKLKNNTILYDMKWKGYSSEWDTAETEWRMTCDEKLIDFAKTKIVHSYIDKIPEFLKNLEKFKDNRTVILNVLDPLSIFAMTTIQCSSVKFVDTDTVGSKLMLCQYIRDCNQHHVLHSAFVPTEQEIDASAERYLRDLKFRLKLFPEYPLVKIIFPFEPDRVFYSPPPLSNILFEPVPIEMHERKDKYYFATKSEDIGFNDTFPFIDQKDFDDQPDRNPLYYDLFGYNKSKRVFSSEKRVVSDSRFKANLELCQDLGSGWELFCAHDVDMDTPLLLMSGIISPVEIAHRTLVRFGERVAFSSFIEIPSTDMCLDRREFYDFSKFIPHSCTPTCSVRLANSGTPIPDLIVYSLVPLTQDNGRAITLDYYGQFTNEVAQFFKKYRGSEGKIFRLYETETDFVHCQCQSPKCREVLYIDKSIKSTESKATKSEKLSLLPPSFEFRGMSIAESTRVWEIRNGRFVE
uniref:Chromo domain-containing protein n=1 Tax=Caenorhabditis tropicalis TaxID=1561998 RepID=A0A1I7UDB5_9PELO